MRTCDPVVTASSGFAGYDIYCTPAHDLCLAVWQGPSMQRLWAVLVCTGSPPACGDGSRAAELHALRRVHERSVAVVVCVLQGSYRVLPAMQASGSAAQNGPRAVLQRKQQAGCLQSQRSPAYQAAAIMGWR